jgi:multidrug resistance efflux pump
MTDVQAIERTLSGLTAKRDHIAARIQEIAAERKALGFKVHAEADPKARKHLDALNAEGATIAGELESVTAAISEAQSRVAAARAAEAQAAAVANAKVVRELLGSFREAGEELDKPRYNIESSIRTSAIWICHPNPNPNRHQARAAARITGGNLSST